MFILTLRQTNTKMETGSIEKRYEIGKETTGSIAKKI